MNAFGQKGAGELGLKETENKILYETILPSYSSYDFMKNYNQMKDYVQNFELSEQLAYELKKLYDSLTK